MPPSTPRNRHAELPRHVVIVGGGRVGAAVAARLPSSWSVVVVDPDEGAGERVHAVRPDASFVTGDGCSRLVLARCNLDARSVFVACSPSSEVNREAARLAREHFAVEERVVLAADLPSELDAGERAGDLLRPADAVAGRIVNRISVEASRAVDVGLGIGEILQVTVLEGSPAAGRALRDFGARHWLVAAVYRAGALIVPHGDTRIAAGDRVLLVGEPADLADVAPFFRGGAPVFPSQYGTSVVWIGAGPPSELARSLTDAVAADQLAIIPPSLRDPAAAAPAEWTAWLDSVAAACLVLPGAHLPAYVRAGFVRSRLLGALCASRRPVVVQRTATVSVRRILVALKDLRAQRDVALAAIDLARQLGAAVEGLHVGDGPPAGASELDRAARLYGLELPLVVRPGNPVRTIREASRDADLVVLGLRPEHNSPLAPDVSTYLFAELAATAVFVPWSSSG